MIIQGIRNEKLRFESTDALSKSIASISKYLFGGKSIKIIFLRAGISYLCPSYDRKSIYFFLPKLLTACACPHNVAHSPEIANNNERLLFMLKTLFKFLQIDKL